MNEMTFQYSHKVIINLSKYGITKDIVPLYKTKKNSFLDCESDTLVKNYFSMGLEYLDENILKLKKFLESIDIEIKVFIFIKNEDLLFGSIEESRQVSYFRLILLSGNIVSYEDYAIDKIFDLDGFKKLVYSKRKEFNEIISLSEIKNINIYDYDIVFPPGIGGYFIHETVGHLLEEDNLSLYKKDEQVYCEFLSVTDDISGVENVVGLNKLDDLGNEISKLELVKNGKIIDSMRVNNGFARKENLSFNAIPRMRCTFVENSNNFKFSLNDKYQKYIKIQQIFGGGVDVRTGDYQLLTRGILYDNCIPVARIENLILCGGSKESLMRICYLGNDLKKTHAYCVKNNQLIDVAVGSPTICLRKRGNLSG